MMPMGGHFSISIHTVIALCSVSILSRPYSVDGPKAE
jgi:hypothetical protein